MLDTPQAPSIRDEVTTLITEIVEQRSAKLAVEPAKLEEYKQKAIEQIYLGISDDEFFSKYYDEFSEACRDIDSHLTDDVIKKMFLGMIAEIYKVKLDVFDASVSSNIDEKIALVAYVEHEKSHRVIWTKAQELAVDRLRVNLDSVFKPLLKADERYKINLFIQDVANTKVMSSEGNIDNYPPAKIMNCLSHRSDRLLCVYQNTEQSENYQTDFAISAVLLWGALSSQYVINANGKDIDVFVGDGEISTSGVFWNYELNSLKRLEMAAQATGGKIIYHRLTPEAKQEIDAFELQMKNILKKYTDLYTEEMKLEEMKADKISSSEDEQLKYDEVKAKQEKLNEELNDLSEKKYELTMSEKSWEIVPFEQLTFKGLNVGGKPFTVENLMNVAQRLKEHSATLQKQKRKKPPSEDIQPGSPPSKKIKTAFELYSGKSETLEEKPKPMSEDDKKNKPGS